MDFLIGGNYNNHKTNSYNLSKRYTTYVEYFVVGTHRVVRAFIVTVDQHLKLGELLIMIGNLLFVDLVLLLLMIFESSIC